MELRAKQPHEDRELIPRILLRAMGLLVLSALAITTYASVTDRPLAAMPPDVAIVEERNLVIYGDMSGAARVFTTEGSLVAELTPENGGFVSGVWRAMARVRTNAGVDVHAPVRLVRFEDGRLGLRDDFTGWRAELMGFGATNAAAFARLMDQ